VKKNSDGIGLQELVEGFLFSLQAEGRAPLTHEYYDKLLKHFLYYAKSQDWPERDDFEFLFCQRCIEYQDCPRDDKKILGCKAFVDTGLWDAFYRKRQGC